MSNASRSKQGAWTRQSNFVEIKLCVGWSDLALLAWNLWALAVVTKSTQVRRDRNMNILTGYIGATRKFLQYFGLGVVVRIQRTFKNVATAPLPLETTGTWELKYWIHCCMCVIIEKPIVKSNRKTLKKGQEECVTQPQKRRSMDFCPMTRKVWYCTVGT